MTADNYRQIAHPVRQAARYERADGKATGYRNGYRPGQMKTAEGMVEFSAPQVRDAPETRHTLRGEGRPRPT
jgi:Transposase, Mutator family